MPHGSLRPLPGRHGTTVSGAARVQGSYFAFPAIALGAARGVYRSVAFTLRAISDPGVPNARSPIVCAMVPHRDTSNGQPQAGVQPHKSRIILREMPICRSGAQARRPAQRLVPAQMVRNRCKRDFCYSSLLPSHLSRLRSWGQAERKPASSFKNHYEKIIQA